MQNNNVNSGWLATLALILMKKNMIRMTISWIALIILAIAFVSANNETTYPDYLWYDEFDVAIDQYNHSAGCYLNNSRLYNCTDIHTDEISKQSMRNFAWAVEFRIPSGFGRLLQLEMHTPGQWLNTSDGGIVGMTSFPGGSLDYYAFDFSSHATGFQLLNFDPAPETVYTSCQDYLFNLNHVIGNFTTSSNSDPGYYPYSATHIGMKMYGTYQVEDFRVWYGVCSDEPRNRPYTYVVYPQDGFSGTSLTTIKYNVTDYNNETVDCDLYIDSVFEQTDIAITYMENTIIISTPSIGNHDYVVNCTDGQTEQTTGSVSFTITSPPIATGYVASYNEADIADSVISVIVKALIVFGSMVTAYIVVIGVNSLLGVKL